MYAYNGQFLLVLFLTILLPLVMGYCDYHYNLGGVVQRVKTWSYQISTQSGLSLKEVGEVKIRPHICVAEFDEGRNIITGNCSLGDSEVKGKTLY